MKKKEKKIEIKKVLPAKLIFFCVAEIWMVFLFGKLKPKVMFAAQTPCLWESMFQGQPVIRQTISITSLADCAVSCWCCRHHA